MQRYPCRLFHIKLYVLRGLVSSGRALHNLKKEQAMKMFAPFEWHTVELASHSKN